MGQIGDMEGKGVYLEQMLLVPGVYSLVTYHLYQNQQLFARYFLWQQNDKCQVGWVGSVLMGGLLSQ